MADTIESQVILSADASQLTSAFNELVNAITQTKEQLKEYRNDKEKSAELTKQLADQEQKLVQIISRNNNVIDSSSVSYKQLDDILKDLRKTYKTTSDEVGRNNLAPAMRTINNELKGMDASFGDFKRNVGNYEGAIDNASRNISESFRSIVQTLPSLTESPERFFMALAQSVPKIISAYKSLTSVQKDAAAATEMQVALDKSEIAGKETLAGTQAVLNTAKVASAGASGGETNATRVLTEAEILETKETIKSMEADLARIKTAEASIEANIRETETVYEVAKAEAFRTGNFKNLQKEYAKLASLQSELHNLHIRETEVGATIDNLNKKLAGSTAEVAASKQAEVVATKASDTAKKAEIATTEAATVATKGFGAALSSVLLVATVVLSVIAIFGKDILNWAKNLDIFNSEARKAARFQKEWNKEMREGHQNAAQQIVNLQIYSRWATMASKSDKERTLAAKEVLKTLGSAATQTNIAMVKNGEYQSSIDDVTKALIRQAQAQALTNKITEKYKEVIEAQDKLAQAENGKLDFLGTISRIGSTLYSPTAGVGSAPTPDQTQSAMDNAIQGTINRAQKNLDRVKEDFDKWLEKFLKDFNPSDLLFKGGVGPDGDKWFSRWELYIKEYEATLIKFQGEYEELDLASIWKYSAEGLEYYTKMYDEYIEHYSGDEKQYREALVNKQKYLTDFEEYHLKLQKQYMDSLKTEYDVDMARLQEWYDVQVEIYKNAGEDTAGLLAEYNKRKELILEKYVDKYRHAEMERLAIDHSINNNIMEYNKAMQDLELQNLDDAMEKEIKEYQRKGIDTTNLEEHYAIERMKIISKYAQQETNTILTNIRNQEEALKRRNEQTLQYNNMGGSRYGTELTYARLGGTMMTGHQQRQNEIQATTNEFNIWQDSTQQQIEAMQEVLRSGKLIGDERIEMETALANTERELALGTAEYRLQLNEMVMADASATTQDYIGYAQQGLQAVGSIFDNIYSAIQSNIEAEKQAGKITEEEAEKRLEEYKGVKAAAAMMDALSSAVAAYGSTVGIPVVGVYLAPIAAAAALAAGIANVKQILATSKDNINATNNYANASPRLSEYTPQYVENLTGREDTDYLANAISERPIKAYVVSSEVTAAQEIENKTTNETTW